MGMALQRKFAVRSSKFEVAPSVLAKGEIQPAFESKIGRAGPGDDSLDAVVPETGGTAEYERVSGHEVRLSRPGLSASVRRT